MKKIHAHQKPSRVGSKGEPPSEYQPPRTNKSVSAFAGSNVASAVVVEGVETGSKVKLAGAGGSLGWNGGGECQCGTDMIIKGLRRGDEWSRVS